MANIMLDLETLGTGYNAVIIQISMVKFDWDKTIIDKISLNLEIEPQLIIGRTFDQSTIDWWKNQSKDIFETCICNQLHPTQVLNRLRTFIGYHDVVWSHATFDIVLLTSLFKDFGIKIPWGYKNARDIRTLVDLSAINLNDYDWNKNKTHNSLDDCIFQIDYCCDAYNSIKSWKDISRKATVGMTENEILGKISLLRNEFQELQKEKNNDMSSDKLREIFSKQNDLLDNIVFYEKTLKNIQENKAE